MLCNPHYYDLSFGLYPTRRFIDVTHTNAWLGMDLGFLVIFVEQCVRSAPGSSDPLIPH